MSIINYICVAPEKPVFHPGTDELAYTQPRRVLCYSQRGNGLILKMAYNKNRSNIFVKLMSLEEATKLCDDFNAKHEDDFKPQMIRDEYEY